MADHSTKTERLARSAVLILIARAAIICVVPLLAWNIKTLVDLQAAIQRIPDQILVAETRLAGRIATVEDRLGAQSHRADSQEHRIERLERPFFEPRRHPQ